MSPRRACRPGDAVTGWWVGRLPDSSVADFDHGLCGALPTASLVQGGSAQSYGASWLGRLRGRGTDGWDERTGYGTLDVPARFGTARPTVDPQEPNDDIDQVRAGRNARVTARMDEAEDPRDVYRIAVPVRTRLTLTLSPAASRGLSLWSERPTTVWSGTRGRLASAAGSTATKKVTCANTSATPRVIFPDVRTATEAAHLNATYTPAGRHTMLPLSWVETAPVSVEARDRD